MTRREYYRRQRRLKAHLKRAAVILALVLAVVLMICGCLYIGERLFKKDDKIEASKDPGNENQEQNQVANDPVADPVADSVADPVVDTETQIKDTYHYEYVKPDASGLSIVLDAGHGGNDPGTVINDTILEKDINLAVTQKVAALLKEAGAAVTMIRETDEYVDLSDRNTRGNQITADLFLSLHCNSYEDDSSINGLEMYYHRNSETSKQYAEAMTQHMKNTNIIPVRDASRQNMQVLRNSSMPAVMIEMGFLSNPEECESLNTPLYQDFLARIITTSIVETLKASATE